MTVSLELDREAQRRGLASVFVPTGQTGIAIAGWGISVDAVVVGLRRRRRRAAGRRGGRRAAASCSGSRARARSLHPAYSGVTLGLVHGSVPHAFVLCHLAGVDRGRGLSWSPAAVAAGARRASRAHLPPASGKASVAAIALNTRELDDDQARLAIEETEAETGLPADDPVRFGPGRLLDAVLARLPA